MNPLGHSNWTRNIPWVVSGTRGLRKSGTGTVILAAVGTYSGTTDVTTGNLTMQGPANATWTLPPAAKTISSSATLRLELQTAPSTNRPSLLGAIAVNTGGTLNLHSNITTFDFTYLNGGSVTGTGTISKTGAGHVTFFAPANFTTFTGLLDIQAGTLAVNGGGTSAMTASMNIASGALFDIRTGVMGVSSLTGTGTIGTSNSNTSFTVGNAGASSIFSGTIINVIPGGVAGRVVGLNKVGSGTLTLTSAVSTYTGITTIAGGIIEVPSVSNGGVASPIGQATNAASNLVFTGGTLRYTGTGHSTDRAFTVGTGGGTLEANGSGTWTRTGAPTFPAANILTLTGTGIGVFNAVIDSAANGRVTKTGAGTWTLGSSNTYTGPTNVNGGTLLVNGSLATGSAVTINGGTLGGTGTINGTISVSNTAGSTLMGGLGLNDTGTLTLSGDVTFGGSNASIQINTNGTTAISRFTSTTLLSNTNLNNVTVNFGAGQNLNANSYNMYSLGLTSGFSGSATIGTKPANRPGAMTVTPSGTNLNVSVSG